MKEEIVSYEQSKALKDAGLDVLDCNHACYIHSWMNEPKFVPYDEALFEESQYDGTEVYPAPTLSIAAKWLREVKGIDIVIEPKFKDKKRIGYDWNIYNDCSGYYVMRGPHPYSESYETALSDAIDGALTLLTEKQ